MKIDYYFHETVNFPSFIEKVVVSFINNFENNFILMIQWNKFNLSNLSKFKNIYIEIQIILIINFHCLKLLKLINYLWLMIH